MESPNTFEPLALFHLALGPLVLAIGVLFKTFPPKSINYWYGFRIPWTMKTQEIWDEANRYSANVMVITMTFVCLFQVFVFLTLPLESSLVASAGLLTVVTVSNVPITLGYLKKRFDSEGQPLSSTS